MKDRALIATGAVGVVLAAICCAAPLLAVVLGAFGLTAWLAKAAFAVIPALLVCLGLVAYRLNSFPIESTSIAFISGLLNWGKTS